MIDQFAKLNLDSDSPTGQNPDVRSPTTSRDVSPGLKRAQSTSSQYSNINAGLHARMKAFQEKRSLKRSSSTNSKKDDDSEQSDKESGEKDPLSLSKTSSPTTSLSQKIVNKPLPPLPGQKSSIPDLNGSHAIPLSNVNSNDLPTPSPLTEDVPDLTSPPSSAAVSTTRIKPGKLEVQDLKLPDISKLRQQRKLQLQQAEAQTATAPAGQVAPVSPPSNSNQFNPTRQAPRRPVNSATAPPAQNRTSSSSLSARRGLKLPPGGLSLKNLNKSTPQVTVQEFASSPSNKKIPNRSSDAGRRSAQGSIVNAIQSTSTSSSHEQHDTAGTEPRNSDSFNSSGSGSSGGLFANFSKYVDIKSGSLNFAGKLSLSSKGIDFSNGYSSRITLDELEFVGELGHGNYGNVSKVLYKPTQVVMAMKEVRLELDEAKFRQILMELEVLHKCQSPFIVDFYGAFFVEGAVYMCMEYMDGSSLDKIYDASADIGGIDEPQLAYITNAVISGLRELKDTHNIIHRDVKPTNILCSATQGTIKLCDFGVSGNLVASLAKTNIGCQSYMAPERIKSLNPDMTTYSVQSDVWSLGLSILEMALGRYPYPPETFDNIFSQLSAIVDGPPPTLPLDRFSKDAYEFVQACLRKNPDKRPTYEQLLQHPWLVKYREIDVHMGEYITERLEKRKKLLKEIGKTELPKTVPALHMGGLP